MYVDFHVIEVVEDGGSYPTLLGIGWDNDRMVVIVEGASRRSRLE